MPIAYLYLSGSFPQRQAKRQAQQEELIRLQSEYEKKLAEQSAAANPAVDDDDDTGESENPNAEAPDGEQWFKLQITNTVGRLKQTSPWY